MSGGFPTPSYSHLNPYDFEKIYEPAEDTFLMLDVLEKEMNFLNKIKPTLALEFGSGSGLIITFLRKHLDCGTFCLASDINYHAAICTKKTALENSVDVEVTHDNLAGSFVERLKKKVDVIIFNPPYVVTPSTEVGNNDIAASWAGGINGREVIDKFIPVAVDMLSKEGVLYLLVLMQNKPEELMNMMKEEHGMNCDVIMERRTGPEHLKVIRFRFVT